MAEMRYKSARALEQAVNAAARKSGRDVGKAIDGFYKDRLLCRIFSQDEPAFVLKGGQSQLARRVDARESRDIDLVGTSTDIDVAVEELKALAATDLGDYLEYRFLGAGFRSVHQEYRDGVQVAFQPFLGKTTKLNAIKIDLVVDETPPREYVMVEPSSRLEVGGLVTHSYAIQKIEERIADKVCATMQLHNGNPSSRVKDLADLVVSMRTEGVDANKLLEKIVREARLRRMEVPQSFCVPDAWKHELSGNYSFVAGECHLSGLLAEASGAEKAIRDWLAPALDGSAAGRRWRPDEQRWADQP